jgi:hypothetical protein
LEVQLLKKLLRHPPLAEHLGGAPASESVFYHSGGRYFRKCLREKLSAEYRELRVPAGWADPLICVLSSSLYYWFWILISDCYHVTRRDIQALPIPSSVPGDSRLADLAKDLLADLWTNAHRRVRRRADGSQQVEVNFDVAASRAILTAIDANLARHYGLSATERAFVCEYEGRYRRSRHA